MNSNLLLYNEQSHHVVLTHQPPVAYTMA